MPRAKLRPPTIGSHHLRRARLLALLDEVAGHPLTLVVAPAGSGKTSLLARWAVESGLPTAWLSLDEADGDGVQLWRSVIAALETLSPGCGERASAVLRRRRPLDDAIGPLLLDLEEHDRPPAVLVIDDLHLVDDDDVVAASLALFARHLPAWLHVILASRRTPRLPVDRWRARGLLGEVRFDELRFSSSEASELLARLAPSLSEEQIAAAAERADGWAASLQLSALAARSDRGRQTPTAVGIDEGALVQDYVLHEVLAGEAPELVETLCDLAVVERVSSSLAHRLTGRSDVAELLLRAEARGLFVTRLGHDAWFAMHSLIRTVLVAALASRIPDRLADLRVRAARWFEEAGEVPPALDLYLTAGQPRAALRLLSLEHARLYGSGREATTRRIIASIPASVATADLPAMLDFAWCHLLVSRRRFLELVEQLTWCAGRSDADEHLLARLKMLQSMAALIDGRWTESGALVRAAMRELGEGWWRDPLGRLGWNMVVWDVALSEQWDESRDDVREAALALGRDPERRLPVEGTRALGEALAGRPLDALRVAAGARHTAAVVDIPTLRAELAAAEAIAHRELGDHARAVAELRELAAATAETTLLCRLLAQLELVEAHLDEGDGDAAGRAFEDVRALVQTESLGSDVRSRLARVGTLVALATSDIDEARRWSTQIEDDFWGGVAAARVHLAALDRAAAIAALDTVVPRCPRHEVVAALTRSRAVDDHEEALKCAEAAIELAAPNGLVQTVASEGAEILELVEQASWRAPPAWMDRLRRVALIHSGAPQRRLQGPDLALTERERDVLRFLPSRLTLREIASELYVSVNTLKFHLKVIYRKLGVTSRAEAAEVARRMTSLRQ